MMRAQAFGDLHHWCGDYEHNTVDIAYGWTGTPEHRFTFLDLEQFFMWCSPETIKQALEERQGVGPIGHKKRVLIA
jgi:hypothetical protein